MPSPQNRPSTSTKKRSRSKSKSKSPSKKPRSSEKDLCSLCLNEFKDDAVAYSSKCEKPHWFHAKCRTQLRNRPDKRCPICRKGSSPQPAHFTFSVPLTPNVTYAAMFPYHIKETLPMSIYNRDGSFYRRTTWMYQRYFLLPFDPQEDNLYTTMKGPGGYFMYAIFRGLRLTPLIIAPLEYAYDGGNSRNVMYSPFRVSAPGHVIVNYSRHPGTSSSSWNIQSIKYQIDDSLHSHSIDLPVVL